MSTRTALTVTRVTAVVHASDRSEDVLELASVLAERFGAELSGRFVMDADFLNMAALPFTHRICVSSGTIGTLGHEMMERALALQAEAVERMLSALAARRRLASSYRVLALPALAAVTEACREQGLVVTTLDGALGRDEWTARLTRLLAADWSAPLLLLHAGRTAAGPVVSFASPQALAFAARLAEIFAGGLVVLAASDKERADAQAFLDESGLPAARVERLAEGGEAVALERVAPGLVVVGRRRAAKIAPLLHAARAHLLIVETP